MSKFLYSQYERTVCRFLLTLRIMMQLVAGLHIATAILIILYDQCDICFGHIKASIHVSRSQSNFNTCIKQ